VTGDWFFVNFAKAKPHIVQSPITNHRFPQLELIK